MADEVIPTAEPNSNPTPTDAPVQTEQSTSTTEPTSKPTPDAAPDTEGDAGTEAAATEGDEGTILTQEPAKGEEGDKDAGADDGNAEPANELIGAPEGDYDLTEYLAEGQAIDTAALEAITPLAKEIGLSNAGLAKLAAEAQPIVLAQVEADMVRQNTAQRAAWDADTRAAVAGGVNSAGETITADPAFQGKTLAEVQQRAAIALDKLAGDKLFPNAKVDDAGNLVPGTFRDFLTLTGLGNHPAMVTMMYRAGAALSEDTEFHAGGDIGNKPKTREEKYYG